MRRRTLKQFPLDQRNLILAEAAFPSSPHCSVNSLGIAVDPIAIPTADALPANLENSNDGCLRFTLVE